MSFSSEVKLELNNISNFKQKELIESELIGYMLSGNSSFDGKNIVFTTENEFNIERLYKILFNLDIEYEPNINGKNYIAKFQNNISRKVEELTSVDEKRALLRGLFLGSGSVNDPEKKYHLEILLRDPDVSTYIRNILKEDGINVKILESNNTIYIKEGEEISKFLAYIGAPKSVLKFEDIRVMKDIRNNVNRQVNCETANINKTVEAAVTQIDAIKFLQKMKKFDELQESLKEIASLRLEYPEASLKELGEKLDNPIGKSGVNHRLKKIIEFSEDVKRGLE
jgi:DNA-binding protein WhiA